MYDGENLVGEFSEDKVEHSMRWAKKWWWLIAIILAIALVIGWKEKRCQTQAYQCRVAAAQLQSQRPSPGSSVYQDASEQQAITAACEPNGYFCRLFSPANLPSMLLVIVGVGAIWAAIRTLNAFEKQANLMEREFVASHRPKLVIREIEMLLPITTHPEITINYAVVPAKNTVLIDPVEFSSPSR